MPRGNSDRRVEITKWNFWKAAKAAAYLYCLPKVICRLAGAVHLLQ